MTDRIVRAPGVVDAPLYDMTVLLNVESSRYHELNPVGARIWDLLKTETSAAEIVDVLVAEFDVSRDDCSRQVASFLDGLRKRDLLQSA